LEATVLWLTLALTVVLASIVTVAWARPGSFEDALLGAIAMGVRLDGR
jgi:hypothetical protein